MLKCASIRRSRTLLIMFESSDIVGYDFLSRKSTYIYPISVSILQTFAEWRDLRSTIETIYHPWSHGFVAAEVGRLLDHGILVAADSEAGRRDQEYERAWRWGSAAGHYHFSIKYTHYCDASETIRVVRELTEGSSQPPLYQTNADELEVLVLPPPRDDGIFGTMKRRRSFRGFESRSECSLSQEHLRDCLFSGLGILGIAATSAGHLPLKMTPSGGARNPFEAYVLAYNVAGMRRGVYHYSALENTLAWIEQRAPLPLPETVVGCQDWFSSAAALIILVANFERTAWKYRHPTGFRVVLIEAGHIAQNMLLAATENGLASAPTCAIDDSAVEALLSLNPIIHSAVYAVALGVRSETPSIADIVEWTPTELKRAE